MPETTIDTILTWFEEQITNRSAISPARYMDGAQKINVLKQNLDEDIVDLQMQVNRTIEAYVTEGMTHAFAKAKAQATDAYGDLLKLKAKKERAEEFIRLAKVQARLQYEDM